MTWLREVLFSCVWTTSLQRHLLMSESGTQVRCVCSGRAEKERAQTSKLTVGSCDSVRRDVA